ncbi:IS30 family transposase [Salicibibacter halophilus]|uniref:IS30 family transposase n=1 Tax=Salicibibacter halophilus TaxID=2502791 RepID=A0A514LGY3_9BACI|nr:IS30 family transposase [Salicibibacter halophilus]QDI91102.1 IS30 family transposase [Salicibibacter halophilus]
MAHTDSSTVERKNKHLTQTERGEIQGLHKQGLGPRAIARELGRPASTIKRELDRGSVEQLGSNLKVTRKYFADTSQCVYETNRQNCGRKRRWLMEAASPFLGWAVKKMLQEKWSPDVCVGRARAQGDWEVPIPCTRTLYTYIDDGLLDVKNIDLHLKVRRSTKKRRSRQHKKVLGPSIEERESDVDTRGTVGHWEIDTVRGKRTKGQALLTLTERSTRKEIVRRLSEPTAEAVNAALTDLFKGYGHQAPSIFQTITADNGGEFSDLHDWCQHQNVRAYFAHPYASFERGTNERHNELLRRFIPKGKAIQEIPDETIERAEAWTNELPRKILGYQTPDEAFEAAIQGAG